MEKEKFIEPNPGINYKDGKLYIFKKNRIVVTKIDQHGPRSWEKTVELPSFKAAPLPEIYCQSMKYIVSPLPKCIYIHWTVQEEMKFLEAHVDYAIIEQMARFGKSHLNICALAMRANGLDLIKSDPALAYILAMNNVFMGRCAKPWRRARSLIGRKREFILRKAGFESSKSTLKILRKIKPDALNKSNVFIMKRLLGSSDDSILNTLRYLPNITQRTLGVFQFGELANLIDYTLLEHFCQETNPAERDKNTELFWLIRDTFRMGGMLEHRFTKKIKSVEQLRKIHDELSQSIYDKKYLSLSMGPFPKSPIPDFSAADLKIEHIKNSDELYDWGKRQRNCIPSYDSEISKSKSFFYRVITSEEEATLEIVKNKHGKLKVSQLLAKCNRPVRESTAGCVEFWMDYHANGKSQRLKDYPLPKTSDKQMSVKPMTTLKSIFKLPLKQFSFLTVKDIIQGEKIFLYQMRKPEKCLFALKKSYGQWDPFMLENSSGQHPKDDTCDIIEQWLWDNTPVGNMRQMKFDFKFD